ncbi:hypothetical protein [Pelosinus sp. sgz500959]|uniref:hypothetical protein n=1 Tax=Pelosinus sp. sgz500959 TaxID=3242472 RepID=UPI00366F43D4
MAKIPKNLSDKSMFGDYQEQITFENDIFSEEITAPKPVKQSKKEPVDYVSEFFTTELQEKVGKMLLEIKVELYKEGIVDFDVKVARQGKQIVLTAVPSKKKHAT